MLSFRLADLAYHPLLDFGRLSWSLTLEEQKDRMVGFIYTCC